MLSLIMLNLTIKDFEVKPLTRVLLKDTYPLYRAISELHICSVLVSDRLGSTTPMKPVDYFNTYYESLFSEFISK